jgi:hypothetical protein
MTDGDDALDETTIHEVLSSDRRRQAIAYLQRNENPVDVNELAAHIASLETGEEEPSSESQKTVYVSLHQTHLPKMDELDIVDYDTDTNGIRLSDSFKDVAIYMEVVPGTEISWSELYLALGVVGIATVAAHAFGAPVVTEVPLRYWSVLYLGVIAAAALYQTLTRRSL